METVQQIQNEANARAKSDKKASERGGKGGYSNLS